MSDKYMPPEDYFRRIVEPTLDDYRREPADHRKENAIFQLSSFSERYYQYHKLEEDAEALFNENTGQGFGAAVDERCPEYKLLWKAANAVKHQIPDYVMPTSIEPSSATETWSIEYGSTETWTSDKRYDVGGREVTLDEAINTVHGFWKTKLFGDGG